MQPSQRVHSCWNLLPSDLFLFPLYFSLTFVCLEPTSFTPVLMELENSWPTSSVSSYKVSVQSCLREPNLVVFFFFLNISLWLIFSQHFSYLWYSLFSHALLWNNGCYRNSHSKSIVRCLSCNYLFENLCEMISFLELYWVEVAITCYFRLHKSLKAKEWGPKGGLVQFNSLLIF